jgi:type IV pilus assembly protein PilB
MQNQDRTISYILEENILDKETLQKVLEQQKASGQSLISILKKNNLVDENQFTRIIAASNKIEFINLSPEMVDPIAAHMVTYDMVNRHNIIPVKKENDKLLVAMSGPLNLSVCDQIEMKTGYQVIPVAATPSAIRQAIHYHFNVENVTKQAIVSMRLKEDADRSVQQDEGEQKSTRVADAPITKLVSSIINGAIDARASDIHIEPQEPDMRVRYRVDGLLRDVIDVPSSVQREVVSHIKILAEMDVSERRLPQDGHIALSHDGSDYDLRVSSLPAAGGEKIVIRILDKSTNKWSLDEIITCLDDNQRFRELVKNPYGMLLLTGPTGCGKTTTLYSVLQLLNTPERNIVTVEDPVEYCLDSITQVQVKPVAGVTFASTLRSALRQDPDIILVGEIRDLETAEIAISAALTGHLVLSTLHTNDAAGAVSRLVNIGIQPFLVASTLLGTVAQRLIRTLCSECKQAYEPSEDELKYLFGESYRDKKIKLYRETGCSNCYHTGYELKYLFDESYRDKKIKLYRGMGCSNCYHTGYHGRKAVYEILPISREIRKMIVDASSDDAIKQQAIKEGMKTLRKSGLEQVLNGTTTLEELLRVVDIRME